MTYTWFGSTGMPSRISSTGREVDRASNVVRTLACLGSRCCTNTSAMPVLGGRCVSTSVKASNPPADAPKPTTVQVGRSGERLGAGDWFPPLPGGFMPRLCAAEPRALDLVAMFKTPQCEPHHTTALLSEPLPVDFTEPRA